MKSRFGLRRVGCLLVTGLAVVSCKPRSSGSKVLDGEQLAAVSGPAAAYQGPEGFLSAEVNQVEWAKYCKGSADVAAPVNPEGRENNSHTVSPKGIAPNNINGLRRPQRVRVRSER